MEHSSNGLILAVSGGNILTSLGGTEKVIISHQKMFVNKGIDYLYIYPVKKNIGSLNIYYYWGTIFNGRFKGLFTTKELINLLSFEYHGDLLFKIHIHHLRGINLHELGVILDTFKKTEIFIYVHDYYLICDQFTLLNDKNLFCGAGLPSPQKCNNCHWVKSKDNVFARLEFIRQYFDRVQFIAPSETAKNVLVNSISEIKGKVAVIYHQTLVGQYKENFNHLNEKDSIKVAFCGLPNEIKGWPVWVKAADKAFENGSKILYYHFGKAAEEEPKYMKNIPVGFQNNETSMTEALRENNIDCVVLWSQWPETYSYVYYECIAANAFLITHKNSGNIAYQVKNNNTGIVLNDDDELENLLINLKVLRKAINDYHSRGHYGPEKLIENDKIIELSSNNGQVIPYRNKIFKLNIKKMIIENMYKEHMNRKWGIEV